MIWKERWRVSPASVFKGWKNTEPTTTASVTKNRVTKWEFQDRCWPGSPHPSSLISAQHRAGAQQILITAMNGFRGRPQTASLSRKQMGFFFKGQISFDQRQLVPDQVCSIRKETHSPLLGSTIPSFSISLQSLSRGQNLLG